MIGVDGCRRGWVVAQSDLALRPPTLRVEPAFRSILDSLHGERALIAIDMPIGLPSGRPVDDGTRACDRAARRFLGPRRATSVFSAPCRPTLVARSYAEACAIEVEARGHGKGMSIEAYQIIAKIGEVDMAIEPEHQGPITPERRIWVREAHPEVVFAALAGRGAAGHGLIHSKRNCPGCRRDSVPCPGPAERLNLLRAFFPHLDPTAEHARLRRAGAGRDDVVDAVACLTAAYRIATGRALVLPDEPPLDARGLRMEIVT